MAIVVEDGTGKIDANSYLSVAEADAYVSAYLNDINWQKCNTETKERALKAATVYLDGNYGYSWVGYRKSTSQSLDWPRSEAIAPSGKTYLSTEVPTELKRAACELAVRHVSDSAGILPDDDTSRGILSERVKVDTIEEEVRYSGSKPTRKRYGKVEMLLTPLVGNGGFLERC